MALRLAARLPRVAVLGCVLLFAGATLTYGAASRIAATAGPKTAARASAPTVVVPDVTGQAFVFAKGALEDAGFAWHVVGAVHGYAVNRVVTQDPAPGTKLIDTGAPTVTVSLARTSYPETGEPEDVPQYYGTPVVFSTPAPAARPVVPVPVVPRGAEQKAPAAKAPTPVRKAAVQKPAAQKPVAPSPATKRPPAFVVAGAPKEPLKEMPLTDRARLLSRWLSAHPKPTNATVRHFLYQNAWVVTGARFGWWHGAQALRLLIVADRKAERSWGIGHKSELAARHALAEVEARAR
jgi:hypothetical protein